MKKHLARMLSLTMTVVLLLSVSICAGAQELPEAFESMSGSLPELEIPEMGSKAEASTEVKDNNTGYPVFVMLVVDKNDEVYLAINAFLAYDPSSGGVYLISTYVVETLAEQGYKFLIYGEDGYASEVTFLDTFGTVALLEADGLKDSPVFEISDGIPYNLAVLHREVGDEWVTDLIQTDFTTKDYEWEGGSLVGKEELDNTFMIGAPIFDVEDVDIVGVCMMDGEGHMAVGSLAGNTLPIEHALYKYDGGDAESATEETKPAEEKKEEKKQEKKEAPEDESNAMLIILAVLAAAGGFWFYNKKKNTSPQKPVNPQQPVPPVPQVPVAPVIQTPPAGVEKTQAQPVPRPEAPTAPAYEESATVIPQALWQLRANGGALGFQTFPINGMIRLGRNPQCDIRFPDGTPGISSRHCMVVVRGDNAMICDVGSTYGTYLKDGTRLQPNQNYAIYAGMEFTLGSITGPGFTLEKVQ